MIASVFIDTGYILALANTRDKYHAAAAATPRDSITTYVTTEAVLTEVGNALAHPRWRKLGVATLNDLRHDPNIEIVPVDTALFNRAIALYTARMDKAWGLTDCISFVVMQEQGLIHVLTTDKHFAQAGFQNVLAEV